MNVLWRLCSLSDRGEEYDERLAVSRTIPHWVVLSTSMCVASDTLIASLGILFMVTSDMPKVGLLECSIPRLLIRSNALMTAVVCGGEVSRSGFPAPNMLGLG